MRKIGCKPWLAVALLCVALTPAPPARAIVGGSLDTIRKAVSFVAIGTTGACTGALIAPDVILTAAHCLIGDPDPANYFVSFDTNSVGGSFVAVSEVHPSPAYDQLTLAHDVGVLVLAAPTNVTPLPWLDSDPGSLYSVGADFVTSGYGDTNSQGTGNGIRRSVAIDIDQLDATTFVHDQSDGHGPCAGDSGAPALAMVQGVETVIGVSSYGDQSCTNLAVFDRTDAESDFIAVFAPEPNAALAMSAALAALCACARRRG